MVCARSNLHSLTKRSRYAVFFERVHPIYPVIDEPSFRSTWSQMYEAESTNHDCIPFSLFCLVVAIGDANRKPPNDIARQPEQISHNLYEKSWTMLHDCLAVPNLGTVQILLLHCIFHLQCGKPGFAWVLCGLATRVAQAVGLHRRSPEDLDLNDRDVRLRSKLWWVAYRLDGSVILQSFRPARSLVNADNHSRFLSMTQGRPASVTPLSFDMELTPVPLRERPLPTTAISPSASDVYTWISKLSQIQHRFCNVTNQTSTTSSLLNELGNIDTALLSWCRDVPMDCRPGEEILTPGHTGHLVTSLHLDYFNMVRAVHWASLICAQAKKDVLTSHPNPRIRGSEAICLSAARSLVKTFNEYVPTPPKLAEYCH